MDAHVTDGMYPVGTNLYLSCDAGYDRSVEIRASCEWQMIDSPGKSANWKEFPALCKSKQLIMNVKSGPDLNSLVT